jgi:type IV secretory pathway VirB10-like protein
VPSHWLSPAKSCHYAAPRVDAAAAPVSDPASASASVSGSVPPQPQTPAYTHPPSAPSSTWGDTTSLPPPPRWQPPPPQRQPPQQQPPQQQQQRQQHETLSTSGCGGRDWSEQPAVSLAPALDAATGAGEGASAHSGGSRSGGGGGGRREYVSDLVERAYRVSLAQQHAVYGAR